MSFRQFGGLQFGSKHNAVASYYNTSNNLLVTKNVGQPNSYINFESDISGNIKVYGDFDLSGNLYVGGNIDCSGNLTVVKDIIGNGNMDLSGNLTVVKDIDCSGNTTSNEFFITGPIDTSPNSVVPKSYVDAIASGIHVIPPCVLCENVNPITLSGYGQVIDGITINASYDGSAILINAQGGVDVSNIDNGVYIVSSASWYRPIYLENGTVATGTLTAIKNGSTYASNKFICSVGTIANPAIIGTDPVVWTIFEIPYKIGRGLSTVLSNNTTFLEVDSSLNFINYLDNTIGGTLNIGTNTNTVNVGKINTVISGNVGIGTSVSGYTLDISGNLSVSKDAVINGVNAGIGLVGSNNTLFGNLALSSNTGDGNAAFGTHALKDNTSGFYNSAFGSFSLDANTTGSYNSAFGTLSLNTNSSGGSNSTFGYESMNSNSSGSYNSAFGTLSLNANTDGSYNSAFGQRSMNLNSSGNYNSAFGASSLSSNTSGYSNCAFGMYSLQNTIDFKNSALGTGAGQSLTGGNSNTFLGAYSDVDIASNGYVNSTALGAYSIITDSNQIMLGGPNSGVYPTVVVPGNLDVSGNVTLTGELDVSGNVTLQYDSSNVDVSNIGINFYNTNPLATSSSNLNIPPNITPFSVEYQTYQWSSNAATQLYATITLYNNPYASSTLPTTSTNNQYINNTAISYMVFPSIFARSTNGISGDTYAPYQLSNNLGPIIIYNLQPTSFQFVTNNNSTGTNVRVYFCFMIVYGFPKVNVYPT